MKKLFYLLAVLFIASCSTDDSTTNNYTVQNDCEKIYETLYVKYDSQDNLVKFNNGQWESNQDLDQDFYALVPNNQYIAFRHLQGWGHLSMNATDGFKIVSVNLLNDPYIPADIFTNESNINQNSYTVHYNNGHAYADESDVYHLVITLVYE